MTCWQATCAFVLTFLGATTIAAQDAARATSVCGAAVPGPATLPPSDSGPVVYLIAPCFSKQGGTAVVEPQTYLYYIHLRPSQPSRGVWVAYDDAAESLIREDFRRLWATNFLDDLSVEVLDHVFANGVIGKLVIYHLEERQRLRLVSYQGNTAISITDIDEKLREQDLALRLDSFLDERRVSRVKDVIRRLLSEKGFLDSRVTHEVTTLPGGPKLVSLTFTIDQGPTYRIRQIEFVGNTAVSDAALRDQMKVNREQWLLSFVTRRGAYKADSFAEDAEALVAYYRERGHLRARIGNPDVRTLQDSSDGKTRFVELRIPVTEGPAYRVGAFTVADNTVVPSDALVPLFEVKSGDIYDERRIRKGFEKAREAYGARGYFEFTAYPEFAFSDGAAEPPEGASQAAQSAPPPSSTSAVEAAQPPPTVNVTLHMQEGEQYFVNRLTFIGNTTTRDQVIRREMQIAERGVFNTEALKYSIRRLNQLGYFKPIGERDGQEAVQVEKTPNEKGMVDVTLKLEEQNRNQMTFGAGMSGIDGIFVNASYSTSNFLGRGETLQLTAQTGSRSNNYQIGLTEPYVFDRALTLGATLFSRKIDYLLSTNVVGYSEVRAGWNLTGGIPVGRFARLFGTYGYEVIDVAVREDLLDEDSGTSNPGDPRFNPLLDEGRHIESRVGPSLVFNTVDNPFTPRSGRKLTTSFEVSGGFLGGTTNYMRPEVEGIWYFPHTSRTALGIRAMGAWIRPFGSTKELPSYRRYFLGGENQIRGVDIRTVGPLDEDDRALGGNKYVLFNIEYYFDIAGPVRALAFHDAGQAFKEGDRIDLRQLRTSSGGELRVLLPVVNVPFRFIYAWNIYRDTFQPERAFKFAVGTTF
jgi:outer membrane protein insertion porin family